MANVEVTVDFNPTLSYRYHRLQGELQQRNPYDTPKKQVLNNLDHFTLALMYAKQEKKAIFADRKFKPKSTKRRTAKYIVNMLYINEREEKESKELEEIVRKKSHHWIEQKYN